jgi:phage terminase small subunit
MSRPRLPAQILELRGAFKAHPERRRRDAQGRQPLDRSAPAHLPQEAVRAWAYIVQRLPAVTFYDSDSIAIEMCARLLAQAWLNPAPATLCELRQWLTSLGMSPIARCKLPPARGDQDQANPFVGLAEDDDDDRS